MILAAMTLSTGPSTGADDPSKFVEDALGRRIIGPDLGLVEVRMFVEAKVPRMPEVLTLDDWRGMADRMRAETLDRVVYRGEAARWRDAPTRVDWQGTIEGGPGYRIKKLRYEAVPGFWVPALLYEPSETKGRVPAVINFDGHDPDGMFADYKQVRCINLAKRGMIALDVDWIGMGQLRSADNHHGLLNHLDLCGTAGVSVFYSLQTRAVDVLLTLANVHPDKIAATGLSGGGWQTIFLGALDPRVAVVAPVAGYSSFSTRARHDSDLGDSEQTPVDLATVTDYALMTAMLAPRAALLTFNARDNCCFAADHALAPLLDAALPAYRLFGRESKLRTHVNHDPGTHNYLKDNRQALYKILADEFFPGRSEEKIEEIPSDAEVKAVDRLRVALPPDQATLHSMALALARDLPRDPTLPEGRPAALAWQADRREKLARIVRPSRPSTRAESAGVESFRGLSAASWKLHVGSDWTVPAVELSRPDSKGTTILLADLGRKEARISAVRVLEGGHRVLAVDLFDVGESKIAEKGWLWNLYVSTVGERPLGLAASQLGSIARWATDRWPGPVSVLADGPNSSMVALVASALEPSAIGDLELRGVPPGGKDLLERGIPFEKSPSSFCFGLLEWFDLPQLVALSAPRRVQIAAPSPRTRSVLAPLKAWYASFDVDFLPAR